MEIVGWVYSHPGFATAPSDIGISSMKAFFNKKHLTTFIMDPFNKRIGRFSLDEQGNVRNDGGFYCVDTTHEYAYGHSDIYTYTTAVHLSEQGKEFNGFDSNPNFSKFCFDGFYEKKKREVEDWGGKKTVYDLVIEAYQEDFEKLVYQYSLFEPLRGYVPRIIEKGINAVQTIKKYYRDKGENAAPKELKTIFIEQWVKKFINASSFPVKFHDSEAQCWKRQLEFALSRLGDIEAHT